MCINGNTAAASTLYNVCVSERRAAILDLKQLKAKWLLTNA